MKTQGATAVDVVVPDLATQVAASNLLTQELKVYLGNYLKNAGAHAASLEEMLETGLHTFGIQAILDAANKMPDDYLTGEDYRSRLLARETLAKAVADVMDANRLAAIAYPTIRRIAPLVGGPQPGSNAALSANTGLPAITVPAGFTPTRFPVGIELIGRRFAEGTLLALAYDYERATRHRRPPAMTTAAAPARAAGVNMEVTAVGSRSIPPSQVSYQAMARFTFDESTRQLAYDIRLTGSIDDVAGVYLHRRANRQNGGVAYVLAKSPASSISGTATLTEAEVGDLKAGKFYLAVLSRKSPRLSARADLAFA
jgi:hypothetical protein